jgi:hypothetical protein
MSPEDVARQNAPAPDTQASMSEKTAASIGERVANAYPEAGSDQRGITRPAATSSGSRQSIADRALAAGQRVTEGLSDQRFVSLIAAFGLGFYCRRSAPAQSLIGQTREIPPDLFWP